MEHEHKMTTRAVVARYIKKRWKRPAQLISGGLVIGLLAGFGPFHKHEAVQPAGGEIRVRGEVESLWSRGVGSPFDAPVQAINVREGQSVRKGELLFRMDTAALHSQLSAARAEYQAARAALAEAQAGRRADLSGIEGTVAGLQSELATARRRPSWQSISGTESGYVTDGQTGENGYLASEVTQPEGSFYDPGRVQELESQIQQARQEWQEREMLWAPQIQAAAESCSRAAAHAGRLKAMLGAADRKSPIDGIVTAVFAEPGNLVAHSKPVVQVDNPAGYRVVTLVDQKVRDSVEPGTPLPLVEPDGPSNGKLEKIVAGWDRELFKYYLWVKPADPRGLAPGQTVEVAVPVGSTTMASN